MPHLTDDDSPSFADGVDFENFFPMVTDLARTQGLAVGDRVEVTDPKAVFTGEVSMITTLELQSGAKKVAVQVSDPQRTWAYVVYLPSDKIRKID